MGYQPEEMVIVGNKLYVANSGGYRVPNYDNTVSVIDLETFKETKKITVAINLHRMRVDQNGLIYVTSRGDYYNVHSNTYVIKRRMISWKIFEFSGERTLFVWRFALFLQHGV